MNELASKLAELLDITVKQAIELYPVLRGQYIWYVTLDNIISVAAVGALIICVLIFFFGIGWSMEALPYSLESDEEKTKKLFVVLLEVLGACIIVAVIGSVASVVVAPDLNFILQVLS